MTLIPLVAFGPVLVRQWSRIRGSNDPLASPDLKLWHRILCVLLAYIFLIGPEAFHHFAQGAIQYGDLSTLAWGRGNTIIEYGYDANGSLTSKTTTDTSSSDTLETVVYAYNLRNRLSKVTTTPYVDNVAQTPEVVEYVYNPSGIRVQKVVDDAYQTDYLIDPYNHTGYAQVLEEWTSDITTPANPVLESAVYYTIGDDVIAQTRAEDIESTWTVQDTEYLLYDGHGSTRQLARPDKSVIDSYSYDGYGVMLGDSTTPNPAQTVATSLLYTGEQYDPDAQQYYLRARYYNQNNGTFNRVDPYSGNTQDPQSLHKYLYCHNNSVNNIDPSGLFSFPDLLCVSALVGCLSGLIAGEFVRIKGGTQEQIDRATWKWFWIGFITTAIIYTAVWVIHTLWLWLAGGGAVTAQQAAQEGYGSPEELRTAWQKIGYPSDYTIHHFILQTAHNINQFGKQAIHSILNSWPVDPKVVSSSLIGLA